MNQTDSCLKASSEVMDAVSIIRAEIDRIWETAWRATFDAMENGVSEDFGEVLNSNPVFVSLFMEMQHSVFIWRKAGMSVDQIPPRYSVKTTKLESLFLDIVDAKT